MSHANVELFPSGDSLALAHTAILPAEFTSKLGIEFEDGCDDLDYYSVAALREPLIGQVLLLSYHRSPVSGTEIMVDALAPAPEALKRALRLLGLRMRDLDWVTPAALPAAAQGAG